MFFQWQPNPQQAYVFFILAGLWGIADAVWQTQINGKYLNVVYNIKPWLIFLSAAALYGVLFEHDEEAAFSNYRLWESLGFIIAFVLQTQVCIYTKLWVLVGVIVAGMAGYNAIEVLERRKRQQQ